MKVVYNHFELEKCAELIFQHNAMLLVVQNLSSADDVKDWILDFGMSHVSTNLDVMSGNRPQDEWISWSSTGGCTVLYTSDGSNELEIRFCFVPSVISPCTHDLVELEMEDQ